MIFWAASTAPVRAAVMLAVLITTMAVHGAVAHVYIVRFTVNGPTATPPTLPLRRTSAAPPFSTTEPSGRSESMLPAIVVQVPAEGALKLQ